MKGVTGRPLAILVAGLFVVSCVFPVVAGFSRETFPVWVGRADVSLALILVILAFVIVGRAEGKVTAEATGATYRAYRVLLHGVLALVVVFFLVGDRIVWINCLTGFAWRAWLLLYCLPAWFTAFRT